MLFNPLPRELQAFICDLFDLLNEVQNNLTFLEMRAVLTQVVVNRRNISLLETNQGREFGAQVQSLIAKHALLVDTLTLGHHCLKCCDHFKALVDYEHKDPEVFADPVAREEFYKFVKECLCKEYDQEFGEMLIEKLELFVPKHGKGDSTH